MKNTLLLFMLLLGSINISNAQNGYTPVKNEQLIKDKFANSVKNTQFIESNFKQIKEMKLLKEEIISTGKFYYKKSNKVRIEYQKPYSYLVILNNGQMSITDNYGKQTQMKTGNSKSLKAMNTIMIDCMNGNIFNNKDFSAQLNENAKEYSVILTPITNDVKSMYKNLNVYFDKATLKISKLIMTELNGDKTTMYYTQIQTNTSLNDQLFKTK